MKKRFMRILSCILCCLLAAQLCGSAASPTAAAAYAGSEIKTASASVSAEEAADALHALGLFSGVGTDANGDPIYELERSPNRHEAVTMLVRLLGKENAAKASSRSIPFADVVAWAKPYVGYAYHSGITKGTSNKTYGGNEITTANQYITFMLRVLGYSSETDFSWDAAWQLSDEIGMTNGEYRDDAKTFTRGDMVIISYGALYCEMTNGEILYDHLIAEGAIGTGNTEESAGNSASGDAPGILEKRNSDAVIDYSNTADGYVMVKYLTQTDLRLKVQVKGPTTTYTYNLTPQEWTTFPLSDGDGNYQITVYKNISGTKYAAALSLSTQVTLTSEFAPFLHSNQYVDYDHAPKTIAKASELVGTTKKALKQVELVYDYVVNGMTYDKAFASTVKSGYIPALDSVLEKKSGICFDYAALMTAMLRSQGVPCKLVVGYAGSAYHAWISVWVEGSGWVDGVIWFDGATWQRMDPTFASSGKSSSSILAYIGDGTNYTAKYFY